ncbi:hypothetical protein D9758_014917 [Tetrapyrgos nigripes]|uniref:Beta-xylosidase C-terminal Concanavalin A-like domain-containing protein n=1 Tax=Tetrapyrgos nigripes TaxID=182062 RepID=A0A8H5C9V4_9AGAR|nr:hypothetical protein D9758_014917 [Tetrapyrgos nigripes]
MVISFLPILALVIQTVTAVAVPNVTARQSTSFNNPVLWEDLADLEVIRVDNAFYYTASTMHYSPGAPILRSFDLVNWEYIGHSVPSLDFDSSAYDLASGTQAYVKGIWASTLQHRPSTGTFFWLGCIEFSRTYVYTAPAITGPWNKASTLNTCYYDAGMLIDDDDTIYVAFGQTTISVAQLSADGLTEVRHQVVYNSTVGTLEGSRFIKRNGVYYILVTGPPDKEYVLRSTSGPFGPYTIQSLVLVVSPPVSSGGSPHQGGFVETQNGDWFYMAFIDAYPGGRMPVLAPVTWDSAGWPSVQLQNGGWGASYPSPLPAQPVTSPVGTDTFSSSSLSPQWEWNHNPDNSAWQLNNGLVLRTATVTSDLYAARNTLTHRILGPKSSGTILLDFTNMQDGDKAGLAMFRDISAWIGMQQTGNTRELVMVSGLSMGPTSNPPWETTNTGSVVATASISGTQVWLRATADIAPAGTKIATFSYSTDGQSFTNLGGSFTMNTDWEYFIGYRFGIFNYATKALGGSVTVKSFDIALA